ncbi:DNA-directed RNA polymerase subunit RPC12/RpoP [Cupriavidus metallidurans]|jgi:DNA-directed RNA polymerase subunit RPC12/RpoP|uniref:hypothetical protein n=1 Tax=Cupriavidus TaxID=106589 RepID=UPI0003149A7F|nr:MULTISPECIES: hypothetical protein [Cupriavidus]KAB0597090.1 zinc ribbon domain-containing protein [Cupriavidus pauculus]MBU70170.1 hypothetical protein [Cupriavidus sp.]MBY4733377.1 hypothetical protein [Cupriavidus pauculus]MCA3188361.1 zinc ribbon domain-containing protein [Cupriavidus sp.]MCA3193855.1 zinc ribbon domain-containing protein [Cupriavidus sp.]
MPDQVLYVYRCSACDHRGQVHFDDDTHDGDAGHCSTCHATVTLEWDGGVTLDFEPSKPGSPRA